MNAKPYLSNLERNFNNISNLILYNCSDTHQSDSVLNNLLTLFKFCSDYPYITETDIRVIKEGNLPRRLGNVLLILALIYQSVCNIFVDQALRATILSELCLIKELYMSQHNFENNLQKPSEPVHSCCSLVQKLQHLKSSLQSSVHNEYAVKKITQHIETIMNEIEIFKNSLTAFGFASDQIEDKLQPQREQIYILLNTFSRSTTLKDDTEEVLREVHDEFMKLKRENSWAFVMLTKQVLYKNSNEKVKYISHTGMDQKEEKIRVHEQESKLKQVHAKNGENGKLPLSEISNKEANNNYKDNQNLSRQKTTNQSSALLNLFTITSNLDSRKAQQKKQENKYPGKRASSVKGYIVTYDPEQDVSSFGSSLRQTLEYPYLTQRCSEKSSLKIRDNPNFEQENRALLEIENKGEADEYDNESEQPFSRESFSKREWMKMKLESLFQKIFDSEKHFKENGTI